MSSKNGTITCAHFDCQFGAAGDMLVAALLDAGVDRDKWLAEVQKIALPAGSFHVRWEEVNRCSISATKIDIDLGEDAQHGSSHTHHEHEHSRLHQNEAGLQEHQNETVPREHQNEAGFREHHHNSEHHECHSDPGFHNCGHHEGTTDPALHKHKHSETHHEQGDHAHQHQHEHYDCHHSEQKHREHDDQSCKTAESTSKLANGFVSQPEFNPTFSNDPKHSHSRHLSQILGIIQSSTISESAKDLSSRIFNRLARAEAQVHGIDPEDVHFHEVGAVDAIVDIVGFAIAFDLAGIESATATPTPLGTGVVKTEHGLFPIPAPAVLKLLQEVSAPSSGFAIPFECLTPTGAAILCEICQSWGAAPEFDEIKMSGYGAGSKNPARWPNVVRVMLGKRIATNSSSRFASESISVLEANIDDQSPQALAFAVEKIIAAGALDAIVLPATMKKSRSGHLLSVLCKPEDQVKFQEMIICETSSIGVRAVSMNRLLADRHFAKLSMDGDHTIRMKLASDKTGKVINAQAEFDDLAKYAMIKDITIKEAQAAAFEAYKRQLAANNGADANKLAQHTEDL